MKEQLSKLRRRRLLLDANLLLFAVAASVDESAIGTGRLSAFERDDVERLTQLTCEFNRWITTPHILTEVSNLLRQMFAGAIRVQALGALRDGVVWLDICRESDAPARQLAARDEHIPFGLTDAGISRLAERGDVILTIDGPLAAYLAERGFTNVMNYNHYRQRELLSGEHS